VNGLVQFLSLFQYHSIPSYPLLIEHDSQCGCAAVFRSTTRHPLQLRVCAVMAAAQQRKGPPTESTRSNRSPAPKQKSLAPGTKSKDYRSEGVKDNDIFLLPVSDFQLLGLLTVVASVVRLFRIYQPSSVVFDEVQ
jgi:hypothetical protein